jgi:cytidylate kinase
MDFTNYNLIIDSTYCLPDKIAEIIIKEAKQFYDNNMDETSKMYVSPRRLVNEAEITEEDGTRLEVLTEEYKMLQYVTSQVITVKKKDDNYEVLEGLDEAKAALLAQVPYASVEVIKNN